MVCTPMGLVSPANASICIGYFCYSTVRWILTHDMCIQSSRPSPFTQHVKKHDLGIEDVFDLL